MAGAHFIQGWRETALRIGFLLFLSSALATHTVVSNALVWWCAFGLLVTMTLPYQVEALGTGRHRRVEVGIAFGLITLALLGPLFAPPFVALAIFLHGVWDLAKHYGAGVPFLSWYCWGCAIFDFAYTMLLLAIWLA